MLLWSLKIDVFCDKKGCDDLSFTSGTFVLWSIRSFQNTFIWWYVCLSNGVLVLLEFLDFIRFLIKFLTFLWVFSVTIDLYFAKHIQGCRKVLQLDWDKVSYQSFKNICENSWTKVFCGMFFFLIEEKICWKYEKYCGSRLEVAC